MYKQVETASKIILSNGSEATPVATLKDKYGGIANFFIDDHCYLLSIQHKGIDTTTAWIFPEAFNVLKTLPVLSGG